MLAIKNRQHYTLWLTLTGLLLFTSAHAFEARSGEEVVIAPGETVAGDLYVSANRVLIQGTVQGDVIAVGRTIVVAGTIMGDLMGAAQTITIRGQVNDDVRAAAYALMLADGAVVGGDVIASGYALETKAATQVKGDLGFGGRQALLAGDVRGDANIAGYGLELAGTVGGTLDAAVDSGDVQSFTPSPARFGAPVVPAVAAGLTLAEGARVAGNLNLTAPADVGVRQGVVAGKTTTQVSVAEDGQPFYLQLLNRFVVLLIVGLLLLWLVPAYTQRAAAGLERKPLPRLGWGVLALVGTPIALLVFAGIVILLVVLAGLIALGGLAGLIGFVGAVTLLVLSVLFVLVAAFLAQVVAGYSGGQWLLSRFTAQTTPRVLALGVGVLVLVLLTAIPVVGDVIRLLLIVLGLGALVLARRGPTSESLRASSQPTSQRKIVST